MSALLKYALRYIPLLLVALFLIPLHMYMANVNQPQAVPLSYPVSSPFGPGSALYGITILPSGEVWAVGGGFIAKPDGQDKTRQVYIPYSGIILHFVGGSWNVARIAGSLGLPLLSVSFDSPRDGWAVGWAGTMAHYNGDTWSVVPSSANFKQNLLGVAMLSASNGWAVGYSGSILHYDGQQWTQAPSPTRLDLRGIAMSSSAEGWAVGDSGTLLHYDHGTWSIINPSPTNNTLNSVTMLSTNEGWAVGQQGTILHYRNGDWESVHPVNYYRNPSAYQSADFFSIAANSIHSAWIAGDQHFLTYTSEVWTEPDTIISIYTSKADAKGPATSHYYVGLYGIAVSPSGDVWAVGSINDYQLNNTLGMFHYQGGKWYIYSYSS